MANTDTKGVEIHQRKSSYKGHTADALAFSDDEGRGKLRKVMGSRK